MVELYNGAVCKKRVQQFKLTVFRAKNKNNRTVFIAKIQKQNGCFIVIKLKQFKNLIVKTSTQQNSL